MHTVSPARPMVPEEDSFSATPLTPNEVIMLLEWDVLETARQFAQSEDLREVMQRAGVADDPTIYFLKDGEQVAR